MVLHLRRALVAALVSALVAVAVSGCGAQNDAVSLEMTKSPAQLLRNEVSDRIPETVVDSLVSIDDSSESCGSDGFSRSWRSTALFAVRAAKAVDLDAVVDELVEALESQGWSASDRSASAKLREVRLTSATTTTELKLTADRGNDAGAKASIRVVANGPCVVTDGPDSEEVMKLEGRA